ncbi:MAG TPA: hypothetical protein VL219_01795 [Steroidobacteraceae bacterium]|jgi:hypothetical protein|nr:hypothetical protein [Steroidobacteraceae bacterium]
MAVRVDISASPVIRHMVARSQGRHRLFPDGTARIAATRRLAELCMRHRLRCIVWCITDRCLHVVAQGGAAPLALATDELVGARLHRGHALSTSVRLDLYLLEVARHALHAPVRGGLCLRAIDWPLSSAQDSCGLRCPPSWLDPAPLFGLLGPRDDRGPERFRRFIESR